MTDESTESIKAQVGYHNYFNLGVFEALDRVQDKCPPGWKAFVDFGQSTVPEGVIHVGQVTVRTADPSYPLYVYFKGE